MKTTVDLPESLLADVKGLAERRGWAIREVFEESLRAFVATEAGDRPKGPFQLQHIVVTGEEAPNMTFADMLDVSGIARRER